MVNDFSGRMERKEQDKLKERCIKEKWHIMKINEAYKKLYSVMQFPNGTKRKKISRNELLRASIDYISRTDTVSWCTICHSQFTKRAALPIYVIHIKHHCILFLNLVHAHSRPTLIVLRTRWKKIKILK